MYSQKKKILILIALGLCATVTFDVWTTGYWRQKISELPQQASRVPASGIGPFPAPLDPCSNLYQLVCQPKAGDQDPTGIVHPDSYGELTALHIYEDIVKEHQGSDKPEAHLDQIEEELAKQIYTEKRVKRIHAAFLFVQRNLIHLIDRQPDSVFNSAEKKILKSRLRKVQLELPPPVSIYLDDADMFTKIDVVYERTLDGKMRLRVGGAFLIAVQSWFNLVFTIGHELGHSIDPCELRSAAISIPAYDRLTGCLLRSGVVASRKTRSECGANDQLSETFADWLGAQVAAEALKHYSTEFQGPQMMSAVANSVKDLCEQPDELGDVDTDLYPTPQERIDKIFGLNPEVRKLLGCTALMLGQDFCEW